MRLLLFLLAAVKVGQLALSQPRSGEKTFESLFFPEKVGLKPTLSKRRLAGVTASKLLPARMHWYNFWIISRIGRASWKPSSSGGALVVSIGNSQVWHPWLST